MQSPRAISVRRLSKEQLSESSPPGQSHTHRSSSLTPPGFLFVFVTLFLALGAINGQNNLLFWLFGFSIASLIVSGIITGTALVSIRLTAHPLESVEAGSPLCPRYTVHNTSRLLPNFALEIIELDAPGFSKSTPEVSIPGIALHIRPQSHAVTQSQITPSSRGAIELSRIRIRSGFPFGLFTKSIDFVIPRQTIILPMQVVIEPQCFQELLVSDDSSDNAKSRRGSGLDYYAIRQYQPGDPARTIAWKQSPRSDMLLVTQYPEPASDQIVLQLDAPSDEVDEELFERAVSLTYSVLKLLPPKTRVSLDIPWASTHIPPSSGAAHIQRCARVLAILEKVTSPVKSRLSGNINIAQPVVIG